MPLLPEEIYSFEVLMWKISCVVLLAYICMAGPTLSADRSVHLTVPSPVGKDIAAMPQIIAPVDDAERRINTALKRLDLTVLKASKDCKGGDWQRSVDVTMRGPGFLSLVITDSLNCDGSAHPDSGTMSIVYDLTTGQPVDWTHLLPATLTGTVALAQQADGTKVVTLASKRLFDLYMAGYGAGDTPGSDLDDCKQALLSEAADGPPGMMVWLDAKGGGLALQLGLPHVMAACEEPVIIPAAVLKTEGAQPALLKAFAATIPATTPLAQDTPAPAATKLPLRPGYYVNSDSPCGEANQAIIIQFTGTAFEEGSNLCVIDAVAREGTSYTMTEKCQEQTKGKKRTANATIVVPDSDSFVTRVAGGTTRYRYCPISSLPASWQNSKETVPDFPAFGQGG
jgi:hypothetical protein